MVYNKNHRLNRVEIELRECQKRIEDLQAELNKERQKVDMLLKKLEEERDSRRFQHEVHDREAERRERETENELFYEELFEACGYDIFEC